ncbi:IS200/IS605 family element RNA-guided endonuclease TnpB [Sporosarcina sp. FA9]|uniref:IS200/IS605 family element RNA-guided endonuclease TnpB n=1 Tax=Sporosarcina sp. FA9 TaxID=3413030 RepID=UPI003F65566A
MSTVHKGFKFRLYPTKEQEVLIAKTIGCSRFVFNHFLYAWNHAYKTTGKGLSYSKCSSQTIELKEQFDWLREVDAHALQSSLKDLADGFDRFFKKQNQAPRFKSKRNAVQSYKTNIEKKNQHPEVSISGNKLKLPKLGWVQFANSRDIEGRILSATVRRIPSGAYFVSLLVECETETFAQTGSTVGIDLGLSDFAILSDGTVYDNPRHFKSIEKKLQKEQRILSRRMRLAIKQRRKLSEAKNYQKQRRKVARIYEKMVNIRTDYLHKISSQIVKNHDIIGIEDLAVSEMLQNKHLSKAISEVSWSTFRTMLTYKSAWYGKKTVVVARNYASSQLCSTCNHQHKDVKNLALRNWICPSCKTHHDRDLNASLNLRKEALRLTAGTAGIA